MSLHLKRIEAYRLSLTEEEVLEEEEKKIVQEVISESDKTASTIKYKYESNADTNAYTDSEKASVASATQPEDLGNLAALDTVGTSEIDTAAVTSNELADTIEIPDLTIDAVETNISTLSAGVAVAANFATKSFLKVTLTDNCTITVSNLKVGVNTLWITQPAAFKTVAKSGWGTLVDNSDDVAEVNNAISIVQFIYNGSTILHTVLTSGA